MKTTQRLSALKITTIKVPGYYSDGGNLYFRVTAGGGRSWIFRFSLAARTRDMGLGSFPSISLAAARKLADGYRQLIAQGIDPIEQRRSDRLAARVAEAKQLTFDECVRQYIRDHEPSWRNNKHRAQWSSTLRSYASPVFGRLPVSSIDGPLVLRALKTIWYAKPETASRLRGRIEAILDWARVHGYRSGENPARWKGNLDHLLPARAKIRPTKHHAAMAYTETPSFVGELRVRSELASQALQFVILTAARTGEALNATWNEIDFRQETWTIPAERMKARKIHRVPLSVPVIKILRHVETVRLNEYLFPGTKPGRPLSQMALLMLLRRMGHKGITVHGFRSTFRDWAADNTSFPREVPEQALAHSLSNAVEAAYRRSDLFEKRRQLMSAWAAFLT